MTRCLLVRSMPLSGAAYAIQPASRPGMGEAPRFLSGAPARRLGEVRRRSGRRGWGRRDLRSTHAARRVADEPPVGLVRPDALPRYVRGTGRPEPAPPSPERDQQPLLPVAAD